VFTGIVETTATVLEAAPSGPGGTGRRVRLAHPDLPGWAPVPGESIAVCGVCLTVASLEGAPDAPEAVFELSAETLARTWLGELVPGRRVNLERALLLSDRLGGHLVLGHVDGGGVVTAVRDAGDGGRVVGFEVDPGLERYLIGKGSVTIDGVSLTVVEPRGRRFDVALIPTTLAATTLGEARVGQRVNVEADVVGKWVERLFPGR
jgi:riboflavin synthase